MKSKKFGLLGTWYFILISFPYFLYNSSSVIFFFFYEVLSVFDVCNYINEIICEEWECIDEGLGDTIKKKLQSGRNKIVEFAKKVINIINIILKKIQDIGRKLFERIKRVPNTTGTSNNTNNSKT